MNSINDLTESQILNACAYVLSDIPSLEVKSYEKDPVHKNGIIVNATIDKKYANEYTGLSFLKDKAKEIYNTLNTWFCVYCFTTIRVTFTKEKDHFYEELKEVVKEENKMLQVPEIKKIIRSNDYTHIMWEDGTKTSVKRSADTPDDPYGAFAQAVLKKMFGSTAHAKKEFEFKQKPFLVQKRELKKKQERLEKQAEREQRRVKKNDERLAKEQAAKEAELAEVKRKRAALFKSNK